MTDDDGIFATCLAISTVHRRDAQTDVYKSTVYSMQSVRCRGQKLNISMHGPMRLYLIC